LIANDRFAALEKVGQHSTDLMIVVDAQGTIIYANPTALAIFEKTLEHGIGTNVFNYLHPDEQERVTPRFIELLETPGGSIRDSIKSITQSGEIREFETVSTNWLDNDAVRASSSTGATSPNSASTSPSSKPTSSASAWPSRTTWPP